jgi:hypothetical protein
VRETETRVYTNRETETDTKRDGVIGRDRDRDVKDEKSIDNFKNVIF